MYIILLDQQCLTSKGPNSGKPCVFPFIYKGVEHTIKLVPNMDGTNFGVLLRSKQMENIQSLDIVMTMHVLKNVESKLKKFDVLIEIIKK